MQRSRDTEKQRNEKRYKIPDETNWRGRRPVAKLILDKIKKNNNILEIGIGKGGVTKCLLEKQACLNVVGFDINSTSLKEASSFLKRRCKGEYKVLNASQNVDLARKFGQRCFDFVIGSGVLDYARDPDKVIKNVKRVLKQGGYFAFTLFDNMSSTDYDGKSPKQMYVSKSGIKSWGYRDYYIKQLLKKTGFKLCSMSLFKRLYTNSLVELSRSEIKAIKQNLGDNYDDHFVILAKKEKGNGRG